MAGGALRMLFVTALTLAWGLTATALAQPATVRMPPCRPPVIDVALLEELLPLELELRGWIVDIGAELCEAPMEDGTLEVSVYYVGPDHEVVTERIAVPEGLDAITAARVLALAIAERVPAAAPDDGETHDEVPSAENALASPASTVPEEGRAPPEDRAPVPAPDQGSVHLDRWLFEGGLRARMTGPLPSGTPGWALGADLAVTAPIDPIWGVRMELMVTDAHSLTDNSFCVTVLLAGGLPLMPYRDRLIDFFVMPRLEVGITYVFAWNAAPIEPWLALGGLLGVNVWLVDDVGLSIAAGGSGVLIGGPVVERDGTLAVTVLNLTPLFAELSIGLVVPL